jgi:hypothetical protein
MDIERLVELATKAICERLNSGGVKVAAFGDVPEGLISGAEIKAGESCADAEGCDYVVMSAKCFTEMLGGKRESAAPAACRMGNVIALCGKRLIHERDLRDMNTARGDLVKVSKNAIITALAYDYAKGIGAKIQKE